MLSLPLKRKAPLVDLFWILLLCVIVGGYFGIALLWFLASLGLEAILRDTDGIDKNKVKLPVRELLWISLVWMFFALYLAIAGLRGKLNHPAADTITISTPIHSAPPPQ